MSYLFDTMALSEPGKARPHANAIAWIKTVPRSQVYVSVFTVGEIGFGVFRLPAGQKRALLETWLHNDLLGERIGRLLLFDAAIAITWARIKASTIETPPILDSLIAATALAHDLTVVTRNERDFARLGVRVINPWAA
jgi:toxin FitB